MSNTKFTRRDVAAMAAGGLVAAAVGTVASGAAEAAPQPFMRDALSDLQTARAALARALPDKGGHRLKALQLVDAAIAQVRMGIGFANTH